MPIMPHMRLERCDTGSETRAADLRVTGPHRILRTAVGDQGVSNGEGRVYCHPPIQGCFVTTVTGFCTPMPYFSTERIFMLYTSPDDRTK